MQALAPITVTVGQDSTLDPSQTKQPIKAVILFNASPVVVKVSGGGQDFYLQPNSTQTMPASTPLGNIILAGISSVSSSSNSGSVYPTLVWMNDVMPGSPSASPVTDINVAGSLDATIQNASIAVQNYSGTTISTSSSANAFSIPLSAPAGGGQVNNTLTIPNNPPMHGALVSGVYTITGASAVGVQITVVGNNTNNVYYSFINNTTNVTNQALPDKLIPVSVADTSLIVSLDSGGNDQSCVVNINFYSQAIPPAPAVFNALIQGLFGNSAGQNVINPYVAMPLLQQIYNNQISSQWGIKIADAVAPADREYTAFPSIPAGTWANVATLDSSNNTILQTLDWNATASNTGRVTFRIGTSTSGFTSAYNNGTQQQHWSGKVYVPAGSVLQIWSDAALVIVFSMTWTTL